MHEQETQKNKGDTREASRRTRFQGGPEQGLEQHLSPSTPSWLYWRSIGTGARWPQGASPAVTPGALAHPLAPLSAASTDAPGQGGLPSSFPEPGAEATGDDCASGLGSLLG